jgi:hypothetical protein
MLPPMEEFFLPPQLQELVHRTRKSEGLERPLGKRLKGRRKEHQKTKARAAKFNGPVKPSTMKTWGRKSQRFVVSTASRIARMIRRTKNQRIPMERMHMKSSRNTSLVRMINIIVVYEVAISQDKSRLLLMTSIFSLAIWILSLAFQRNQKRQHPITNSGSD